MVAALTALREWAAGNLTLVDGQLSAAQLAAAQKATRPGKPEELSWGQLQQEWAADVRGLHLDRASFEAARAVRTAASAHRTSADMHCAPARAVNASVGAQAHVPDEAASTGARGRLAGASGVQSGPIGGGGGAH